jgi:hypothetical protein
MHTKSTQHTATITKSLLQRKSNFVNSRDIYRHILEVHNENTALRMCKGVVVNRGITKSSQVDDIDDRTITVLRCNYSYVGSEFHVNLPSGVRGRIDRQRKHFRSQDVCLPLGTAALFKACSFFSVSPGRSQRVSHTWNKYWELSLVSVRYENQAWLCLT